jgi:alpha-amylase/alpha-mannosidase (GH57 family)
MNKFICIHGHFYQPPRENPWLEAIELQDSAYPYHDWNQRITAECYAPNTAARILDHEKRIIQIVNNYAKMSFNFGPTLLSWMEKNDPETYSAILEADKISQRWFKGHGSALMQCYNHMIMPLANSRDKITQIVWGIRDFEYRFLRSPEGAWLPETAVDLESLELLANQGIKFTILAPHQAKSIRRLGSDNWVDVSGGRIDPRKPYLCRLPSGRSIVIFFYDGPISRDVAFNNLLLSGNDFANRLMSAFVDSHEAQLVHIATDGETYGHHQHRGDMALAYCLNHFERSQQAQVVNYGYYLEIQPVKEEVQIFEHSSWSCVHGIERWRNDCGCRAGGMLGWNQQWRAPLRAAMDWLSDQLKDIYELQGRQYFENPWEARDGYIEVLLDRSPDSINRFLLQYSGKKMSPEEGSQALQLLEMQRYAMFMYTSCGWFFDEISGIETTQILQYAARAIQLAKEAIPGFNGNKFYEILSRARSNLSGYNNGAQVFEKLVQPKILDLMRVGAHYAVSSLFEEYSELTNIYCYKLDRQLYDRIELGKQRLVVGRAQIQSSITLEDCSLEFAVLYEGEQYLTCGVRAYQDEKYFVRMQQEVKEAFRRYDIARTKGIIENHFGLGQYSFEHLFKDEQRKILYQLLDSTLEEVEQSLRQINEHHQPIIRVIKSLKIPLPRVLSHTVILIIHNDFIRIFRQEALDLQQLQELVNEAKEWILELDKVTLGFIVARKIDDLMAQFFQNPEDTILLETMTRLVSILQPLTLQLDLWKAQNLYFAIGSTIFKVMKLKARKGDGEAQKWEALFSKLGDYFHIKIT